MSVQEICTLIETIVAVVPTLVAVGALVYNIIKNKNWALVQKMIQAAMTTVEDYAKEHTAMTSAEKQEMAIEAVKASCAEAGITVDAALLKRIVAYIEQLCSWSKTVNAK